MISYLTSRGVREDNDDIADERNIRWTKQIARKYQDVNGSVTNHFLILKLECKIPLEQFIRRGVMI